MLLSKILPNMAPKYSWRIENEREFCTLALASADAKMSVCSFLDTEKYMSDVGEYVVMILTTEELAPTLLDKGYGVCVTSHPRVMFFLLQNYLATHAEYGYVREKFESIIGENCSISEHSVIAKNNVVIGNNVTIEEFVVVRENTTIGDNTVIRAGTKVGGVGFECKRRDDGSVFTVEHCGGVVIGHDVEIQYNTCIDRAIYPWDNTIIGDYCRLDNLIHIAHAVKLGKGVMVVANCGIGGRTTIGDNAWIGFGAVVRNGISVGKNSRVNMGAVVTKSVADGESVTGNFAIEHAKFIENMKKSIE